MKSISEKFLLNQEQNPSCSSIINFIKTIKEGKFTNWKEVEKNFNKLVEKEDYARSDKRIILEHMKSSSI